MSNQVLDKIKDIQKELNELETKKDLPQSQRVIASIVRLLDDSVSVDDQSLFQLFTDSDGKIRANASWFYEDSIMTDRKATYKVHSQNKLNLDIKFYGITKPSKRTIAWAQSLTPNFEDEPFNKNFNVGIDFIVPKSADRIIVVLSNNWVIRTLELKGKLTVTFQEILAHWAEVKNFDNKTELHNILWESFDIQPLNKKFYSGISERFTLLRQYLVKEKVFDEKHASLFANRLIGRVIFCWFLDKKGIINPGQKYFDSASFDDDSKYYKNKLEKLFFSVLNTPISERERKLEGEETLFGKEGKATLFSVDNVTPFLNGGLFEARKNDLYNDSKLSFPKNYFDDLFEFLSGYNFTTDESTSQFQQVAIDPEMLGRIFENLLAEMTEETGEQARKAKGAFYTPREIVDYMCKESLKEYLKTKIEKDEQLDQRLYQLIDAPDKDFQDQDHNWRRDWKPYKVDILKALDELKVLDPACGSGAFPIGMLQLLVRVYERLEARFDSYKTKLGIIEKNIYGVDIEPMAVEIARLRAWLSIIVDEESDSKKIKPLPNLEFKFICANSLIDLDKNGNNTFGDDPELQEKLGSIRDAYFNTESLNKKKKLRGDYEKLVTQGEGLFGESKKSKQLKTYRPFDNEAQAEFFNPQFMFGTDSFDIIIANPPYVRQEKFTHLKESLKREYGDFFNGRSDLYTFFISLGFRHLKTGGVFCYITSNKFLVRGYGENTRKLLIEDSILKKLVNFGELPVFQASVDSIIILAQKEKPEKEDEVCFVQVKQANEIENLYNFFEQSKECLNLSFLDSGEWSLQDKEKIKLLNKIKGNELTLESYFEQKSFAGIKTGYDDAFVIDSATKEKLISEDPKNLDLIKPWLRGKDVKKWKVDYKNLYLIYIPLNRINIEDYPSIKNYLLKFEDKLSKRATKQKWYEIQQPQEKFTELFEAPKIIYPDCAKEMRASYDLTKSYGTMAMYFLPYDPLILGLLNSRIFDWYSRMTFATFGDPWKGGRIIFKTIYMSKFPLPNLHGLEVERIKNNVEIIIKNIDQGDKNHNADLEAQINEDVMTLYGLDENEKSILRTYKS